MAILLQNLLARSPQRDDLDAVIELIKTCEAAEDSSALPAHNPDALWHRADFDLEQDARVIKTHRGQFVGYASVHAQTSGRIEMAIYVHPDYRKRGIGTLLLRLTEHRARQLMLKVQAGARVTLTSTISNLNATARHLLEQEGYEVERHTWRIALPEEDPFARDVLAVDAPTLACNMASMTLLERRTGFYVARRYDVYAKELRARASRADEEREPLAASV